MLLLNSFVNLSWSSESAAAMGRKRTAMERGREAILARGREAILEAQFSEALT